MLKILVKDSSVTSATINGKNGAFTSNSQAAWIELPSGEIRKVRVRIGRDGKPYAVGSYSISDDSFDVGKYGDLQIGNLVLVALPQVAQRVA